MRSTLKKIITVILTTISILIFLISIAIMFIGTKAIQENKPLFIFNYSFSIVPTDSMVGNQHDSIDRYDIAIIKKVHYSDISIGQVIVFQGEIQGKPALIIHRVIGDHLEGGYQTKGDNPNYGVDLKPVTEENFQAVFVGKITFMKVVARLAAEQKNIVFLILVVILLMMVITELMHIIKKVKHNQKETLEKEQLEALKKAMYEELLKEEQDKLKKT